MDTFLATFGILGWGAAIASTLWFNSETKRLASELRLATLKIATLTDQNARSERTMFSIARSFDKPQPGAILRREIRAGHQPRNGHIPPAPTTGSGVRPAPAPIPPQPDNFLPGMIIGMALGSGGHSKSDDAPAAPEPSSPSQSYDSGSSYDSGGSSSSYDSGSSGSGSD